MPTFSGNDVLPTKLKKQTKNCSNLLQFFVFSLAFSIFFVSLPRQAERKRPGQRKRILRFVPRCESGQFTLVYEE